MTLSSLLQIAYFATPLTCWLLNALVLRRRIHWSLLFILSCVAGFAVLMVTVQVIDVEVQLEINRHDTDGDGSISGSEMTAEAERAMHNLTSDTGRALAPITGFPITFVWTAINFIVLAVIDWSFRTDFRSLLSSNSQSEHAVRPESSEMIDPETGNPYQPPTQREDSHELPAG
jgi:hypothetical protein